MQTHPNMFLKSNQHLGVNNLPVLKMTDLGRLCKGYWVKKKKGKKITGARWKHTSEVLNDELQVIIFQKKKGEKNASGWLGSALWQIIELLNQILSDWVTIERQEWWSCAVAVLEDEQSCLRADYNGSSWLTPFLFFHNYISSLTFCSPFNLFSLSKNLSES